MVLFVTIMAITLKDWDQNYGNISNGSIRVLWQQLSINDAHKYDIPIKGIKGNVHQ